MPVVTEADLKSIAPYEDAEFPAAMERVLAHPAAYLISQEFFSSIPREAIREKARATKTVDAFQTGFIDPLLKGLEKRTTSGISMSGIERHSKESRHLYLSNHRDILLDPSLFTDMLYRNGHRTPQICLGDNLLIDPLVADLMKMNKGITVKRSLAPRELLRWSWVLSTWIRRTIVSGKDSVWIAQQEGRAKTGVDETHPGVIKMLSLSSELDFVESLEQLNIVPVTISYEYDTSDVEKAYEVWMTEKHGEYRKGPLDDILAIQRGVRDFKGGIHIAVGESCNDIWASARLLSPRSEQMRYVVGELDTRIRGQYRNWPSNYIASDLLSQTRRYADKYNEEKLQEFEKRLAHRLEKLALSSDDNAGVREKVLSMYAASVQ